MQFCVFSGDAVEWNDESDGEDCKNAKKVVGNVQSGRPGKAGVNHSAGGTRSKLSAMDSVQDGFIKVGSIKCSAFGGLYRCESM